MSDPAPVTALATVGLNLGPAMLAATQLGKDGVEVLERLHAIHKEERAFNAKKEFAEAMAALKADLRPVVKSVPGQHGVSRAGTRTRGMFAPLDSIAAEVDPLIVKNGFSYRFGREIMGGKEYVTCVVTHRGGHSETTPYPAQSDEVHKGKTALQATASGDTYCRRYAFTAAFSIVTADPDDDGNAAAYRGAEAPASSDSVVLMSDEHAANLRAVLDEAPNPDDERKRFLGWLKVESLSDVPDAEFHRLMGMLTRKRAAGWKS